MCKEALFINLNHLAVPVSQFVWQTFSKYPKMVISHGKNLRRQFIEQYIGLKVQISFISCRHV